MAEIILRRDEVNVIFVGVDSFLVIYRDDEEFLEIPFTAHSVKTMLDNADQFIFAELGAKDAKTDQ